MGFLPLERENGILFLFQKEKVSKRSWQACRLTGSRVWGLHTAKPTRSARNGCCAARGSLGYFDRMEAFLLVRLRDEDSPKSLFQSRQVL